MSSRTKKQSHQDIPSKRRQQRMRDVWQAEKKPAYLVEDSDGNALRVYTDLSRAENWTRDTNRKISLNRAAWDFQAELIDRDKTHV